MNRPSDQWSTAFAKATVRGMQVYDDLVATMFIPFTHDLIERLQPAPGCVALDIACGPGTVTRVLASRIGPGGRVMATDISPAMLEIARAKPVAATAAPIEWIESPAAPLPIPDATVDAVACQQGLQFFPDKIEALREMRRVLGDGGRAAVTFWEAIVEQPPFAALQRAIATVLSPEVAARYGGPFSLTGDDGAAAARAAGFAHVHLERVTLQVELPGGPGSLLRTLDASGIATDIRELDDAGQGALLDAVTRESSPLLEGDTLRSTLTTSLLLLS